ncbi:Uncharacterized protein FWK35_00013907 [Aphis craccivora]|uniref:Uncharacterized protein n=1 Tax=Aphis craccivora TaxID=307492 RepID=A0A6G0Y8J2_APHCR|nr:Uncharacterized protein FWK35_00013907 [Aphis craccivora]
MKSDYGLSLDYGDVEYTVIQKIFQLINYNTIYVKGLQKCQIISEFMPHVNVVNMEDQVCPRLNNLLYEDTLPRYIFHMQFNSKQCTLYKYFHNWFINILNKHIPSFQPTQRPPVQVLQLLYKNQE